jgi:hypothetical protein
MSPVEVGKRPDPHSNGNPMCTQIYAVPTPKFAAEKCQYVNHDRAIYSLWNHFVYLCESESQSQIIRASQQRQLNSFNSAPGTRGMDRHHGHHSHQHQGHYGSGHNNGPANSHSQEANYFYHPERRNLILSFSGSSLARPAETTNEFTKEPRLSVFVDLSQGKGINYSPKPTQQLTIAKDQATTPPPTTAAPVKHVLSPATVAATSSPNWKAVTKEGTSSVVETVPNGNIVPTNDGFRSLFVPPGLDHTAHTVPGKRIDGGYFIGASASYLDDQDMDRELTAIHRSATKGRSQPTGIRTGRSLIYHANIGVLAGPSSNSSASSWY